MDTMKSTSPRGFWGGKKIMLVFQITLRINQDCLNVEVATGCMWLIFQCTSEEDIVRYIMVRTHVLTSWWCSCHREFTSLAHSVIQINSLLAVSKLGCRNREQWCKFRFQIKTCLRNYFFFSSFCNKNLYLLLLILDFFTPTSYSLIPIFSSHYMHMFIKIIEDIHEARLHHIQELRTINPLSHAYSVKF